MSTLTNPGIVPGRPFHALRKGFRTTFLTIHACLGMTAAASACQTEIRPWSDYPFEIQVQSPAPGEARIQIWAGDEATPMHQMLGFELEMELGASLGSGTEIAFFPAADWATEDGNFTAETHWNCESEQATFHFWREACSSVSGQGKIGEIWISGLGANYNSGDMLRITGGIVIEEIVIGVRMSNAGIGVSDVSLDSQMMPGSGIGEVVVGEGLFPRSTNSDGSGIGEVVLEESFRSAGQGGELGLRAYPQPAATAVQIDLETGTPTALDLYDLQGQLLRTRSVQGTGHYQLDLHDLPAGTYLLRCESQDGQHLTRRIVHQ